MIVSFVPGRIRLRFKELKNPATAEIAKARIGEMPGIANAEINPATGSILIEYDSEALPTEKLMEIGGLELAKHGIKLDLPPRFS